MTGLLVLPYLTIVPARLLMRGVTSLSTGEFITAVVGLIVGLLMGLLLGLPLARFPDPYGRILPIGTSLVLGLAMLGFTVAKRHDLLRAVETMGFVSRGNGPTSSPPATGPLIVVDTSVLIDGRIADIAESGFISGTLLVPASVLAELQQIADQADVRKRTRGRRGLDILAQLQKSDRVTVELTSDEERGAIEVDAKLVVLAKARGAAILTNDLNLNKVADLAGDPGAQRERPGERPQAGVPSRRHAPRLGDPGGQGARPGRRVPR